MTDKSPQIKCFELDGAIVRGDPNMSAESKAALREIIDAAKQRLTADSEALRMLSVELEQLTGYDSIPTIEAHYQADDNPDVYVCAVPRCGMRRRDPAAMWRHVHFSRRHGLSFGVVDPSLVDLAALAKGGR